MNAKISLMPETKVIGSALNRTKMKMKQTFMAFQIKLPNSSVSYQVIRNHLLIV